MIRIALIPLDERPVNTRYPQMLAEIAGAEILLPPSAILGHQRQPADVDAVGDWLRLQVSEGRVDAAVVSCDFLAYGNLINARISDDSATRAMKRLTVLEELGGRIPVHAFSLITRVANSNENREEPQYWANCGMQFHAYARLTHRSQRQRQGDTGAALTQAEEADLATLAKTLPKELLADWLTRRLRNHTVNLAMIDLAARGKVASLLLTSDDTSPYGFSSREREWLASWVELVSPGGPGNVRMHPGADEVGSALVAKLIGQRAASTRRVFIIYSTPEDAALVAPYEDRPVRETVESQIEACGCEVAREPEDFSFILAVVTPSPRRTDYKPEYLEEDRLTRKAAYYDFLHEIGLYQSAGLRVALADVAYPNGSDPLLTEMLLSGSSHAYASQLVAFGAWNTAGNTLGTVVAQAICELHADSGEQQAAQQRLLTHHFLEDYGYQQVVRREARAYSQERWGRREPDAGSDTEQAEICGFIEGRLEEIMGGLHRVGVGLGLRLQPGSVHLPWRRLFEVDFDLVNQ